MRLDVEPVPSPQFLADAFSEFITASSVLEASYRDLQLEVTRLNSELSQRNLDLTRSLDENTCMRSALEQILDSMPCGVLVLDQHEHIEMINPEGAKLLGLREVRIRTLHDLSRLTAVNFEALAHNANGLENEISIELDSVKRWLAISYRRLNAVESIDRTPETLSGLRSIWILRDITARKHAEQEREAARRATTLAEISAILAHEIKNPLASLELFAGLIEQEPQDSAQWVSHLQAGIRALSGTVNNVLSLNGHANPQFTSINLPACVESGVEFVRPIAEQAGVQLTFSSTETDCAVLGNEDAIRQIVLNVVCNAIRHTRCGGQVRIAITRTGDRELQRVQVSIEDTGCGIPASVLPHIFDAGFSGSGETPGLGLAVCRRLMDLHGADIRASSHLNKGSKFELEFPVL